MVDRYTTTEADAGRYEQIRAADEDAWLDDRPTDSDERDVDAVADDAAAAVASEVLYVADHPQLSVVVGDESYVHAEHIRDAVRRGVRSAKGRA